MPEMPRKISTSAGFEGRAAMSLCVRQARSTRAATIPPFERHAGKMVSAKRRDRSLGAEIFEAAAHWPGEATGLVALADELQSGLKSQVFRRVLPTAPPPPGREARTCFAEPVMRRTAGSDVTTARDFQPMEAPR